MAKSLERCFDVIIGGGGYAGLALGLALARTGGGRFQVAVVDARRAAAQPADGRASALTAASRHLLSALGIWQIIEKEAQPVRSIEVTDSALEAAIRPRFLGFDTAPAPGEAAAHIVANQVLRAALQDAAAETPAITLLTPYKITAFEAGTVAVTAHLDDAGPALAAPLLIAADGRASPLRRLAGIKSVSWRYPQTGIVTTVSHENPHNDRAIQHFLPAGPFAILPLTGNRASLVWAEDRAESARILALDDRAFLGELSRRFGRRLGRLSLAGPRLSYPLETRLARALVAPRLALLGDAARAVHPLAGQGLNIGLRDVAALTQVLVEAARLGLDIGAAPVLTRYERWRRFDGALSALGMDAMNRLFSNDSGPLRALRTLGLGLVDRAPWLKSALVAEAAGLTGDVPRLLKGEAV